MQKLVLKKGRERSVIHRHPWIFSGAVQVLPDADNGEIVCLISHDGDSLGYGFFSTNSQITCRIFEFTSREFEPDGIYWNDKIQQAFLVRKRLINFENTNIFRLLHAEGDFLPGVIIDIYKKVAVVQLLIRGTEKIQEHIFNALHNLGYEYIYLKTKSNTQLLEDVQTQSGWLQNVHVMPIEAVENGIKFLVDVEKGQKTGFFIDQRENRRILGEFSKGKRVLNLFSYSGGFSLYAISCGATMVHSVDSSKDAIEMGDRNVELNFPGSNHKSFVSDVFDFLKAQDENYDVIVVDPPAFAKNARAVPNASRGYKNINMAAIRKVNPGGLVFTFSCSQHIDRDLFRKIIFGAASDVKRNVRIIGQLTQPADHPVNIFHPEGEYLKGLVLYVE